MSQNIHKTTSNPWMQLMRNGEFEKAWKLSDQNLPSLIDKQKNSHLPRHFQRIWNGKPLEGKRVLVRCYHGLGDTIQFIRYAPLLNTIAKEVIVWAQPSLIPLLKTIQDINLLLPLHDGSPEVEYDVDVEIMELPHIFRTSLTSIPSKIPYLHVEPMPLSSDKKQIAVGLIWQSGDWNQSRSIPYTCLAPLAEIKNINYYILQSGAASAGWQEGFGINPGEFSLLEYARVIRELDLMITVDSMPAHLAGALGVQVWNLLHTDADWRWMENRYDSPWYPTMRLFRQERPGEWDVVIHQVTAELKKLVKLGRHL